MMRALAAPAGRGFRGPRNVRDPFSPRLGRTRGGMRGGVLPRGHRMAVPAAGPCLRGGRAWRGGSAGGEGRAGGGGSRARAGRGGVGGGRDGGRFRGGVRAAGGGGLGGGGVRVVGGGGEADHGKRNLARADGGPGAFHASYPAITGMR